MLETLSNWWNNNKDEVGKCVIIAVGALVWYVGRELMYQQRLPFVAGGDQSQRLEHDGQTTLPKEA
ncbi:MAG: hypothetical protein HY268_25075 [Deltaproteobacteria bacterium]|nr:hypothetical protein [Deltaproteobacteria bacterium]